MNNKAIVSNRVDIGNEIGQVLLTESQIKEGIRKLADKLFSSH